MQPFNITWKILRGKYQQTTAIFIGKVKVAGYYYNAMRSRDDPKCYTTFSYASSTTAKTKALRAIAKVRIELKEQSK